jgi:hypothetical protein
MMQEKELRFGGKLAQVETTEAEFVGQLEHLRDFYMQPLLGQKPMRRAMRTRVFSFDQLAALFQRNGSSSSSCNTAPTKGTSIESSSAEREQSKTTGIGRILKGFQRQTDSDYKLDHKAVYQPSPQNEFIVSAPFDFLFQMIEHHTSFLIALKTAYVNQHGIWGICD